MSRIHFYICLIAGLALVTITTSCKSDKDSAKPANEPAVEDNTQKPAPEAPDEKPGAKPEKPADPIAAALAHEDRPDADKARDADRKPAEVLAFYGVKPGMKVAELLAGSGYYAEILARVVGPEGKVYAQNNDFMRSRGHDKLVQRAKQPGLTNIVPMVAEFDQLEFPEKLDAVFIILAYHDQYEWKTDRAKMNKIIYDALKPGGVYAVIDHYAEDGSGERDIASLHRGDKEMIRKDILASGFVLDGESDILRHPEDKRDKIVFDPSIRGKTDRFVFKFIRPADK